MKIDFDSTALEELYSSGTTLDKRYKRLPEDIIRRYVKTVNYLKAARRIEDLYLIKSLATKNRLPSAGSAMPAFRPKSRLNSPRRLIKKRTRSELNHGT